MIFEFLVIFSFFRDYDFLVTVGFRFVNLSERSNISDFILKNKTRN